MIKDLWNNLPVSTQEGQHNLIYRMAFVTRKIILQGIEDGQINLIELQSLQTQDA